MGSSEMTEIGNYRYTIQDFIDIAQNGFSYTISDATLDIISALATQVGAPDYVKTPNFTTKHENKTKGHGRRRKQQEMSDEDWEDLRSFHAKPKADLSADKLLEKRLRGELNKIVSNCSRSQLNAISEVFKELHDNGLTSNAESIFFDLATCSKINTGLFAQLFCDLVENDDDMYELLSSSLKSFVVDVNCWEKKYGAVEYISEDENYDRFCDVNRINDLRLNTSRFIGKVFQLLFEKEDMRFNWFDELIEYYNSMRDGFQNELLKSDNDDVAMIYCANIIEFFKPVHEYIYEYNNNCDIVADHKNIIASGSSRYPSLSRQIVFTIQGAFELECD